MRKLIIIAFTLLLFQSAYSDSLSIFFLGDTYFGESYQSNPKYNDGTNVIEEYGYDYFFENVKGLLKGSDYTIANLETSLYPYSADVYSQKPYSHWSYGEQTCQYLSKYGIDAVSLGNNHVMDYGLFGYVETTALLNKYNINWFGAGDNSAVAPRPLLKELYTNFSIAVFGGFEYRTSYDSLYHAYSGRVLGGINRLDTISIKREIEKLNLVPSKVFTVAFPHWGKNYKQAMEYQKDMAHALIDAGVDLIIGHGAHTIQEAEYYKGKWIIYNIGNFIFNAPGRYRSTGAKPYGFMAELVIKDNGKVLKLHPIFTDNMRSDYQVRFLDEDEFEDCGKILKEPGVLIRSEGDRSFFEIKVD